MNNEKTESKQVSVYNIYISILDSIKFLFSKWLVIFIICIAAGLIGILSSYLSKPKYISTITFSLEEDGKSAMGVYANIASQFGIDLGGASGGFFMIDNMLKFMKSETILRKTLFSEGVFEGKKDLLINKYIVASKLNKTKDKKIISFDSSYLYGSDRVKDSVLKIVFKQASENLLIEKIDKKTTILSASYVFKDEAFAKQFIEILTNSVIDYYVNYRNKKAKQNVDILQHQADSVYRLIGGSISSIAVNTDVNVNPLKQISRVPILRKQIDMQTGTIVYGEILKQLELAKIMLRRETPLIQIIDEPVLPLKNLKLGKLLTGLLFAFLAGVFTAIILLLKRYFKKQQIQAATLPE